MRLPNALLSVLGVVLGVQCSTFGSGDNGAVGGTDSGTNDASDGDRERPPITGRPQNDVDASDGAAKPRCDPKKPWGTPIIVPELSSALDDSVTLTRDELTAFLGPGFVKGAAVVARRAARSASFGAPSGGELSAVNASNAVGAGSVNADGTVL